MEKPFAGEKSGAGKILPKFADRHIIARNAARAGNRARKPGFVSAFKRHLRPRHKRAVTARDHTAHRVRDRLIFGVQRRRKQGVKALKGQFGVAVER